MRSTNPGGFFLTPATPDNLGLRRRISRLEAWFLSANFSEFPRCLVVDSALNRLRLLTLRARGTNIQATILIGMKGSSGDLCHLRLVGRRSRESL